MVAHLVGGQVLQVLLACARVMAWNWRAGLAACSSLERLGQQEGPEARWPRRALRARRAELARRLAGPGAAHGHPMGREAVVRGKEKVQEEAPLAELEPRGRPTCKRGVWSAGRSARTTRNMCWKWERMVVGQKGLLPGSWNTMVTMSLPMWRFPQELAVRGGEACEQGFPMSLLAQARQCLGTHGPQLPPPAPQCRPGVSVFGESH